MLQSVPAKERRKQKLQRSVSAETERARGAMGFVLCLLLLLLTACKPAPTPIDDTERLHLDLNQVLGGGSDERFLRAEQPRVFEFPRDHGNHPGYRNEWWYLTGNLSTTGGRRFAYQVTFFRAALQAERPVPGINSEWDSDNLWMAHVALSDIEPETHIAVERFSRQNPGLAGAQIAPLRVWLENWSLSSDQQDSAFPWRLEINDPAFSLKLLLSSEKMPVLQGDEGLSQKSPTPGNASYYYSYTRLQTSGELTLADDIFQLSGSSWLDREWSTSALTPEQSGWDWFSLQFNNEQELMYYRLLDTAGEALPESQGSLISRSGTKSTILPEDIRLEALRQWQGPDGNSYTTQWALYYQDKAWRVEAVFDEQFMNVSLPYWEGAVNILDLATGEPVGQGFLEMVRN